MKASTFFGKTLAVGFAIVLTIGLTSGCAKKPILDSLDPNSGPPGTAVNVIGENLSFASVRWDAGKPSEKTIPSSFLGAGYFTVPLNANAGSHPVRLHGNGKYSDKTINFKVTAKITRPAPRLDDVTVSLFGIESAKASMALMAHGANIDVGAEIRISGTTQSTYFSRLLRNTNLNATDASTLGYPVYHYATVWCALTNQTPGSNITVSIKNLDGKVSNNLTYHIAKSMDELDSDGDGLLDDWEKYGYDADGDGKADIKLPALGAKPLRKDLFVEVDWMKSAAPNGIIWSNIQSAFNNAPVLNPDGSQGISIHIDRGQPGAGGGGGSIISYATRMRYDDKKPSAFVTYANLYTVKSKKFDSKRKKVYRYCVFAWDNGYLPGASGQVEGIPCNDFFVSLGSWKADGKRADFQTGTFMHELGHTLGLRHGGFEDTNSKDNYNSIMQYDNNGWIKWNKQDNMYSPSQFGGIDIDCDMLDVDAVYTYSQGQRRDLNESNLNENQGICDNFARDWNGNGNYKEENVSVNLDDNKALTVIKDYADWANIQLNFRASGSQWKNN